MRWKRNYPSSRVVGIFEEDTGRIKGISFVVHAVSASYNVNTSFSICADHIASYFACYHRKRCGDLTASHRVYHS